MHLISTLNLLALPLFIFAKPILFQRDIGSVSQADFADISYYGQYAAASYCTSNTQGAQQASITCRTGNCSDVQGGNQNTELKFDNVGASGCTGFVAIDKTRNLIVVSFRGTQSIENLRANLKLSLVPTDDVCPGCKAHEGFYNSWVDVRGNVTETVKRASAANPGFRVLATGHSLGAGIATIAGVELRKNGFIVDLAPFASSRVGNSVFGDLITAQDPTQGRNFRVIHTGDLLPDLIPVKYDVNGNYAHFSPAYQITTPSGVVPTANDLNLVSGDTLQNALTVDPAAHNFYINDIAGCGDVSVDQVVMANGDELKLTLINLVSTFPPLIELASNFLAALGISFSLARQVAIEAGAN